METAFKPTFLSITDFDKTLKVEDIEQLQEKVNKMLVRGVIFSIFWMLGIGSFIAILEATKARKLIVHSNNLIEGMGKVWWCFIVGGLGLAFWIFVLISGLVNNYK